MKVCLEVQCKRSHYLCFFEKVYSDLKTRVILEIFYKYFLNLSGTAYDLPYLRGDLQRFVKCWGELPIARGHDCSGVPRSVMFFMFFSGFSISSTPNW